MGYLELNDVSYALPGGWLLFEGVSFKVPEGEHAALVGANGIGKSTLLRLIVGIEEPTGGSIRVDGRVGLMRQFIGSAAQPTTVRGFLLAYAEPRIGEAAARIEKAERWMHDHPGEDAQMRYADALAHWGDVGGYEAEVVFDACTHAAFGQGYPECAERRIETLSGGERKRLALEVIFRSAFDVILLDEPDNTLDIAGKRWLEDSVIASRVCREASTSISRRPGRSATRRTDTSAACASGGSIRRSTSAVSSMCVDSRSAAGV